MGLLIGIGLVGFRASRRGTLCFTRWCLYYWLRRGRRTYRNNPD